MKKKSYKVLAILLLSVFTLTGCFDDDVADNIFNDQPQVEFNQTASNVNYVRSASVGEGNITEQVNLIGPQMAQAQTIAFSVDTENSSAIEGTHYNLNGGSFEIPANSSFGDCTVEILGGAIPAGESRTLVLVLDGNSEIRAAGNYKTLTIQITP